MKTNKIFTFAVFAMTLVSIAHAQTTIEKTLSKSFNLQGKSQIRIDLPNVEVRTWDEAIARIEIQIACENVSEAMLKSLITAGRYNVQSNVETEFLVLSSPTMSKTVKLNGQDLKENVKYVLNVPKDIGWIIPNSTVKGSSKVNGTK
jgi:hypothetical protein